MPPSRHRALIRVMAVLLLLWVGFDVGAHGFLASDFGPPGEETSAACVGPHDGAGAVHLAHDHCFCHAVSVGAVLPAIAVNLAPLGAVVRPLSAQVPRSDGTALDHPPQLAA